MLVALTNAARDYAWGSTTLLAALEGRAPSGAPEAEVWFGDHPGSPAVTADGRTLDRWLADERPGERLPYLLKLLAAASPLSIQAHPSKRQAEVGFAREEAAGLARDAGDRTYRDDNHKPELIVALSDEFSALAGLRPYADTRRLLAAIGPVADPLAHRLTDASSADAIAWALSGEAPDEVRALIAAARVLDGEEFAAEAALVARLDDSYPGDPGILVALLMNLVTLRRGEGLFLPAGVLHAYLDGLGVELMAASDNVLRGGLTPKHIDVDELLDVLVPRPEAVPVITAEPIGDGVAIYPVPVPDFSLVAARPTAGAPARVSVPGTAIVVATAGALVVRGGGTGESVALAPGRAALVTADEGGVIVEGDGEAFVAAPGR